MQKYLVWNPQAGFPTASHSVFNAAKEEAKRLARLHRGQEFHVMISAGCAVVREPDIWVDGNVPDQMFPF